MDLDEDGIDFARVARAIRYLVEHAEQQPELDEVARAVHLSPFHFQRMFTRFAGTSPKRFLQYLTLQKARAHLAQRRSILEAAHRSGLSGPGRLHSLFVTMEAMTPGEFKSGGEGLTLRWGVHPTPFGDALVAASARGISALHFVGEEDRTGGPGLLRSEYPRATLTEDPGATRPFVARIFDPGRSNEPIRLHVKGTPFQLKVWEALLRIPAGEVVAYEDLACSVGRPRAVRAAASAVGTNPLAWLIPCHRVIRKSGALGGYRWGLSRKEAMLAIEAAHEGHSE
jgi:AraC family transcriptional regulator of adaptative response/methylated-DNA-[protein]-cysteine methyltransferase